MPDTSAAILMQTPTGGRALIYLSVLTIVAFIIWAYFARIDVRIQGSGKVIPVSRVQLIQNLEGGIISDILVTEGDQVNKSQPLMKLDNTLFQSSYKEHEAEHRSLVAASQRLTAEINNIPLVFSHEPPIPPEDQQKEQALFENRQASLKAEQAIAHEQVNQARQQLKELQSKETYLSHNLSLASKELELTRPLRQEGAVSEVDLLRLEQGVSHLRGDLEATRLAIPRLQSSIEEAEKREQDVTLKFQQKAISDHKAVLLRIAQINEIMTAHRDRVNRTTVRSPVKGTVKKVHFNTLGGVAPPGRELMEIVPYQDQLLIEARIQPKDIAFLRPGLPAVVKISAYDFAIYGSLKGVVEHISADTIQEEGIKGAQSYYLVRIRTEKNHLGNQDKPIIPGMVTTVDIITNKRSILASICKPVLKGKEQALRER
ncbi:HlyD family type I secretion periplasmic adaptor subunit [Endozoicomonas sp. Mp262]|uniref:HlyD family type I secretion periplasmic adaptor subunit n=1 Tax=Endozoicomonas sp. Mp262 TaxID=2919499 RepID=UPI0021D87FF0